MGDLSRLEEAGPAPPAGNLYNGNADGVSRPNLAQQTVSELVTCHPPELDDCR